MTSTNSNQLINTRHLLYQVVAIVSVGTGFAISLLMLRFADKEQHPILGLAAAGAGEGFSVRGENGGFVDPSLLELFFNSHHHDDDDDDGSSSSSEGYTSLIGQMQVAIQPTGQGNGNFSRETIARYVVSVALMIVAWFSFCYGQLQRRSQEQATAKNEKSEKIASHVTTSSTLSTKEATINPVDNHKRKSTKTTIPVQYHDCAMHFSNSPVEPMAPEQRDPEGSIYEQPCERTNPAPTVSPFFACQICSAAIHSSWKFCSSCGSATNTMSTGSEILVKKNVQNIIGRYRNRRSTSRAKSRHEPEVEASKEAARREKRRQSRRLYPKGLENEQGRRSRSAGKPQTMPMTRIAMSRTKSASSIDISKAPSDATARIQNTTKAYNRQAQTRTSTSPSSRQSSDDIILISDSKNEEIAIECFPKSLPNKTVIVKPKTTTDTTTFTTNTLPPISSVQQGIFTRPKSLQRIASSAELAHKENTTPTLQNTKNGIAAAHSPTSSSNNNSTSNNNVLAVKFRRTDSICIGSRLWPVSHLAFQYPPKWGHANKKLVADLSSGSRDANHQEGWIRASRWSRPSALPKYIKRAKVYVESGQFSYDTSGTTRDHMAAHWYLDFAGSRLFGSGDGTVVDSDELKVLEHPSLASLALAINDAATHGVEGLSAMTYEAPVGPTPILIKGAQQACVIDTTKLNLDTFCEATEDQIRSAVQETPVTSSKNILALPTIASGEGKYTTSQIKRLFIYAYTGFRALVLESGGRKPVLHSGFWGCEGDSRSAGDKGLTTAIQILAAGTAGIKYIHFTPGKDTEFDRTALQHGVTVANALHGKSFDISATILATSGYTWGNSGPNHLPYQPPADSIWTN